jgi:hypothetical protein
MEMQAIVAAAPRRSNLLIPFENDRIQAEARQRAGGA